MNNVTVFLKEANEYLIEGRFDKAYWKVDNSISAITEARTNPLYKDNDEAWIEDIYENDDWDPEDLSCHCRFTLDEECLYNQITRGSIDSYTNLAERLYRLFNLRLVADVLDRSCYLTDARYSGADIVALIEGVKNKSLKVGKSAKLQEGDTTIMNGIKYTRLGDVLVSDESIFTYTLDTGDEDSPELFLTRDIFSSDITVFR